MREINRGTKYKPVALFEDVRKKHRKKPRKKRSADR